MLSEYSKTSKKTGVAAIKLREGDEIVAAALVKDEDIIIYTKNGMGIKFNSSVIGATSRATIGVKGITLKTDDEVIGMTVVRDKKDDIGIFTTTGFGRRVKIDEIPTQARAGKGVQINKDSKQGGQLVSIVMLNDSDSILAIGITNSICISAKEITKTSKLSMGTQIIKGTRLQGVSKV